MMISRKFTCSECPFLKKSLAGWLADYTPSELLIIIMGEKPFPCHMDQQEDVKWEEVGDDENPLCAGALMFMKKNGKIPRNYELAEKVKEINIKDCDIILSSIEFIKHHTP